MDVDVWIQVLMDVDVWIEAVVVDVWPQRGANKRERDLLVASACGEKRYSLSLTLK